MAARTSDESNLRVKSLLLMAARTSDERSLARQHNTHQDSRRDPLLLDEFSYQPYRSLNQIAKCFDFDVDAFYRERISMVVGRLDAVSLTDAIQSATGLMIAKSPSATSAYPNRRVAYTALVFSSLSPQIISLTI